MSQSILDTIAAQRRLDVAQARMRTPEARLREWINTSSIAANRSEGPCDGGSGGDRTSGVIDLYTCVMTSCSASGNTDFGCVALAAEFKRASPSKGDIAVGVDAGTQARVYVRAGASIVSVLTEPTWFKGSLDDMKSVRAAVQTEADEASRRHAESSSSATAAANNTTPSSPPRRAAVLRKDFIIDSYQLLEARAYGADTALLIVAILPDDLLRSLINAARDLGMEPLVEVNSVAELHRALAVGAEVIGVNNRNLHTFRVDLGTTERVARALAEHNAMEAVQERPPRRRSKSSSQGQRTARPPIIIALSGITSRADVERYERCGVRGVLVGEALMRASNPAQTVQELLGLNTMPKGATGSESLCPTSVSSSHCTVVPSSLYSVRVKVCGIQDTASALVAARAGADFIGLIFAPKSKRCVKPSQARKIVSALRAFREQEDDLGPSPVQWYGPSYNCDTKGSSSNSFSTSNSMSDKEDGAGSWFRAWATELDAKCTSSVTRPLIVGVFQNQSETEVCRLVKESGVDLVQLHGDEEWEAAGSRQACGGVPSLKVVHIEVNGSAGEDGSSRGPKRQKKMDAAGTPAMARRRLLGLSAGEGIPPGPSIAVLLDTKVKGGMHAGGTGVSFDWGVAKAVAETEAVTGLTAERFPLIVAGGLTPENVADAVRACRPWGVDVASGVEKNDGSQDKDHEKIRAFIVNAKAVSL